MPLALYNKRARLANPIDSREAENSQASLSESDDLSMKELFSPDFSFYRTRAKVVLTPFVIKGNKNCTFIMQSKKK